MLQEHRGQGVALHPQLREAFQGGEAAWEARELVAIQLKAPELAETTSRRPESGQNGAKKLPKSSGLARPPADSDLSPAP